MGGETTLHIGAGTGLSIRDSTERGVCVGDAERRDWTRWSVAVDDLPRLATGHEVHRNMLTWKPLPRGAILYDEFRPGSQELAEHIFGAFRISESGGSWELTEYERRSGAGYRAQATRRFATREAAVAYAEEVMAATRG